MPLPKEQRCSYADLLVVCDQNKVDRRGVYGAPDLMVEVLSPGTAQCDRLVKFNLYQCASAYGDDAAVPVAILDDCVINLSTVFPEI